MLCQVHILKVKLNLKVAGIHLPEEIDSALNLPQIEWIFHHYVTLHFLFFKQVIRPSLIMSHNGYLLLLLSVAILTAESFQLAPTTTRSITRFTVMSNNGARTLRTAFATAALTFAFNADFSDNNRMLSFTPSPVHARGVRSIFICMTPFLSTMNTPLRHNSTLLPMFEISTAFTCNWTSFLVRQVAKYTQNRRIHRQYRQRCGGRRCWSQWGRSD